MPGQLQKIE